MTHDSHSAHTHGTGDHHGHSHSHEDHHSHEHGHGHSHSHVHEVTADSERRVLVALIITAVFMVVEIIAGYASHSLALVSDGVHMLSDTFSLGLALFAFRLGRRPPNATHSYGFQRMQVLAAFSNGLILFLIGIWIVVEALGRLLSPENVAATPMLIVAVIGLVVNGLSFWILEGGDQHNLNVRGAALHVMGDLLGSIAAIIAAVIIKTTGFTQADPLLSILACVLILRASHAVLRRSSRILLEGVPEKLAPEDVRQRLNAIDNVVDVHDLHLWSLTDNDVLLTAHLVTDTAGNHDQLLADAHEVLNRNFNIGHATLQVEYMASSFDHYCCQSGVHP